MTKYLLPALFLFVTITSLCRAQNPILWGMSVEGGANGMGIIFKINAAGTFTDMHDFGTGTDGERPYGSLMQADNGFLYGMTYAGGAKNDGAIFSYDISTGTETDIHDFGSSTDGQHPYGSLIQASNGLLYGMTNEGGANNKGIIFSYDISTSTEIDVYDFKGGTTDGKFPFGSLLQVNDSMLYGMTWQGGAKDSGTIFSYNISSGVETDKHDFTGSKTDGSYPFYATFIQADNGLLYGMTQQGGAYNGGTIFNYNISTGTDTVLHSFGSGTDGKFTDGSLVQATNGLLYGMTLAGGMYSYGMMCSYDITTGAEIDVFNFSGSAPYNTLIQGCNGLLYGMTYPNYGTIFSYDISTNSYANMHYFTGSSTDGESPNGNLLEVDSLLPLSILPKSPTICIGTEDTLKITGGSNYTWSPASGLSVTTGSSVVANPTITTVYSVTANDLGCPATALDTVYVNQGPSKPTISSKGNVLISSATQGNQWVRNDTVLQGATNQTYTVIIAGYYQVMAKNPANGCSTTSDSAYYNSTGIDQLSVNNNQLSIYPNPTPGEFTIKLLYGNQNGYTVEIYNVMGEKVYELVLSSSSQASIDLSTQPSGMYFVYLKSEENVEVQKLLLVK